MGPPGGCHRASVEWGHPGVDHSWHLPPRTGGDWRIPPWNFDPRGGISPSRIWTPGGRIRGGIVKIVGGESCPQNAGLWGGAILDSAPPRGAGPWGVNRLLPPVTGGKYQFPPPRIWVVPPQKLTIFGCSPPEPLGGIWIEETSGLRGGANLDPAPPRGAEPRGGNNLLPPVGRDPGGGTPKSAPPHVLGGKCILWTHTVRRLLT